jgi:hypothetical protein
MAWYLVKHSDKFTFTLPTLHEVQVALCIIFLTMVSLYKNWYMTKNTGSIKTKCIWVDTFLYI